MTEKVKRLLKAKFPENPKLKKELEIFLNRLENLLEKSEMEEEKIEEKLTEVAKNFLLIKRNKLTPQILSERMIKIPFGTQSKQ